MHKHKFNLVVRIFLVVGLALAALALVLAGPGAVEAHGPAVEYPVEMAGPTVNLTGNTAQSDVGIGLLASDASGVTLALNVPDYEVQQFERDGQACQQIRLPFEHGQSGLFGAPDLPQLGVLLGVPPQVQVSL
ncbi:MAG: hypothetical protein JW862_01360, partial [Anaerolineales bacterium]|nr:hypothetical protein [Anaerolineales bacterium]